jgi:hypothetical protein
MVKTMHSGAFCEGNIMEGGVELFEKAIEKIKGKAKEIKEEKNADIMLMGWKEKLEEAITYHSSFREKSNLWDKQYNDDSVEDEYKLYMSNRTSTAKDDLESNVNITMQLIEGSIDVSVPKPAVSAIESADGMENRKMIEGMLTYMSECSDLQKIVSENERITKKNGMSVIKVSFDPNFNGRTYRGKLETTNPHPVNFIPQPNVSRIADMDYCFQIETKSIDQICRTYGEQFRLDLENEGAEFGYLENFGTEAMNNAKGMVSIVECWYKDQDGDVCLITWADNIVIRDLPKFYYPRSETGEIEYIEQLEVEEPVNIPIRGEAGDPQFDQMGEVMQEQVNIIEVERRVPKSFPFVLWYNIPREKSIYGVSDCQIIQRQQDSIKRMITKEERKQNKGTTKILARRGSGIVTKIKDAETQIIETDDPQGDIRVVDIKTPSNGVLELYQLQLQAAKDLVGVTEASQGRTETANMSGKALEMLTQNTASRLSIKTNEKYIAFRELYQLYYEFLIAYYDDKVPFRIDAASEVEYGYFDKSKLLKQDITGEFYYPDFDIYINADAGMAKDKNFMIQIAEKAMMTGAADAIDYWTIMDSINMPNASFILERARARMEQQMAMQEQQMAIEQQQQNDVNGKADAVIKENEGLRKEIEKNKPQIGKKNIDIDEMAQVIAQLDPKEQEQFFSSSPEQQQQLLSSLEGNNE